MAKKKPMNDMIPPDKRTIRRVPLGHTPRTSFKPPAEEMEDTTDETRNTETSNADVMDDTSSESVQFNSKPPRPPKRRRGQRAGKKKWKKVVGIIVVLIIILAILFSLFTRATITITPRQETLTVDGTFAASREGSIDELAYETFSVTRDGQELVNAIGEKYVEAKASGTIVVFNDFSEEPQLLIANTRFETPEGLVYRIQDPITVPGQTTNEEGDVVPGSIEVRVSADQPGDEYNIGRTDFTLPGLKESGDIERFDAFYARSKTDMSGGFAGTQKTINTQEAENARTTIDIRLEDELKEALAAELPEGFVVYDDATFMNFRDLAQGETEEEGEVLLRRRGTLQAVVFDENEFAEFVAQNSIASYDGGTVRIEDPSEISFVLLEKDTFNPNASENFSFNLNGQGQLVWELDEERLIQDLAGKNKRETPTVLSGYPSIIEADIAIYPFWKQSFPEELEKIHLEYKEN